MADTTAISILSYPEQADTPNVPSDLQGLATDIDTILLPRFATTGDRDTAIPSPSDGAHAFVTSNHKLYVYRGSYSAWQPYVPTNMKMKTAQETLATSTTLQDDNHITGIPYKANTYYHLRGVLFVNSPAAADFKIALVLSSTPVEGNFAVRHTLTANQVTAVAVDITTASTTISPIPTQGSTTDFITLEAFVKTHASTAGTMKLQWAQVSSSGTTTVFAGSYMEILEA